MCTVQMYLSVVYVCEHMHSTHCVYLGMGVCVCMGIDVCIFADVYIGGVYWCVYRGVVNGYMCTV